MTWDSTKTYQLIGTVLFILFLWFFTEIVVYLVISAIIGVVGQPFVKLLSKIKIRKKPFPKALSATISLIIIILVLSSIMAILVPSIASQAEDLAKIDKQQVATQWGNIFTSTELRLREINILKPDQDLETIIVYNFSGLLNKLEFSKVLGSLVDMTGNLFMGVFSVLFMSFFFIKEEDLFQRIVMLFVSEKYERSTSHILLKIKKMLSRYFFGILIEVSTMMLLITIGGLIIGLENAILIGFIGGLMNIIPYLGTLIILVLNGFFPSVEEENKYCKSRNNLSSKAIKWAYSLSIIPIILIVMAIVLSKLTDNNENVNDVLTKIPIEKEIINTAREIPTNVLTDKDTPHIRMETYTTDQNRYVKLISNKKSCIVEYNHLWNNGVEMTNCLNYKSKDNEQMLCTEEDNCIKRDEVNYFLVSGKKFQENYDKYITPFIGEKTFNFDGGSGTGKSIEITNNAIVTIMLHGIYSSSIIYQGKYKNLTKESPYMLIEDVLCYKEPGFEMQCTKL